MRLSASTTREQKSAARHLGARESSLLEECVTGESLRFTGGEGRARSKALELLENGSEREVDESAAGIERVETWRWREEGLLQTRPRARSDGERGTQGLDRERAVPGREGDARKRREACELGESIDRRTGVRQRASQRACTDFRGVAGMVRERETGERVAMGAFSGAVRLEASTKSGVPRQQAARERLLPSRERREVLDFALGEETTRRGSSRRSATAMRAWSAGDSATRSSSPARRSSETPTLDTCAFPASVTTGTPMNSASQVVVVP